MYARPVVAGKIAVLYCRNPANDANERAGKCSRKEKLLEVLYCRDPENDYHYPFAAMMQRSVHKSGQNVHKKTVLYALPVFAKNIPVLYCRDPENDANEDTQKVVQWCKTLRQITENIRLNKILRYNKHIWQPLVSNLSSQKVFEYHCLHAIPSEREKCFSRSLQYKKVFLKTVFENSSLLLVHVQ